MYRTEESCGVILVRTTLPVESRVRDKFMEIALSARLPCFLISGPNER